MKESDWLNMDPFNYEYKFIKFTHFKLLMCTEINFSTHKYTFERGMNPTILPPAMDK